MLFRVVQNQQNCHSHCQAAEKLHQGMPENVSLSPDLSDRETHPSLQERDAF